jgi:hypothetical protein
MGRVKRVADAFGWVSNNPHQWWLPQESVTGSTLDSQEKHLKKQDRQRRWQMPESADG